MTNCPHCGGAVPDSEFGKRTSIPTHSHETPLGFGKYRGQTTKDLLQTDPQYLAWVHNNVESVIFIPQIVDEIRSAVFAAGSNKPKETWPRNPLDHPEDDYIFSVDLDDDVPF